VVFDLDGVLSDASCRQHFLEDPARRDWRGFFDACGDDALLDDVARLVELLDEGVYVILLTGRPVRVRPQTLTWLDRYKIRWDLLIMRLDETYAAAQEFKRGVVGELRAAGFDLRLAFEDDRRSHQMFKQEGVPCVYIYSGYYG
jgi:hypothetical protein